MKKLILALTALTIIGNSCNKKQETIVPTANSIVKHSREIIQTTGWQNAHSEKRNCLRKNGNCAWAIIDADLNEEGCNPVTIRLLSNSLLSIIYTGPVDLEDGVYLTIASSLSVPSSICSRLGKSSITIVPGTYEIKYNVYEYGERIVDITTMP